jgi:hypothetical protein
MAANQLYPEQYLLNLSIGAIQAISKQLPWEQLTKASMMKFRVNGMHGAYRPLSDAQFLYKIRVPDSIKMLGEPAIKHFLKGKDASHIQSHTNGGSGTAHNILFENYKINRARGSRDMNQADLVKINLANRAEFLRHPAFYKKLADNTAKGMLYGALFSASTSAFVNIWNAIDHEQSWDKAVANIVRDAQAGAIWGAVAGFGFTVLAVACPPVGGAMSMLGPCLGLIGGITTGCGLLNFALGKVFSKKPKVSLLVKPRTVELLMLPEPQKLTLPPKFEVFAPQIEVPKVDLYIPPKHPLCYVLDGQ